VSAFISVASRLMQIKSEALLPRPPVRGPNEVDPGEELTRQLIVYKRFKHIAEILGTVYAEKHSFLRWAPLPKNDPQIDLKGITIGDLMLVAKYVLSKEDQLPSLSSVVAPPKITIREKIAWIVDYLRKNRSGVFTHLLKDRSRRIEIVVTFLALLELVKRILFK